MWDEIIYPFPHFNGCSRWSVGMDKQFDLTLRWAHDNFILGIELIQIYSFAKELYVKMSVHVILFYVSILYMFYCIVCTTSNG